MVKLSRTTLTFFSLAGLAFGAAGALTAGLTGLMLAFEVDFTLAGAVVLVGVTFWAVSVRFGAGVLLAGRLTLAVVCLVKDTREVMVLLVVAFVMRGSFKKRCIQFIPFIFKNQR
jgi:hypothetical protein